MKKSCEKKKLYINRKYPSSYKINQFPQTATE